MVSTQSKESSMKSMTGACEFAPINSFSDSSEDSREEKQKELLAKEMKKLNELETKLFEISKHHISYFIIS